MDLPVLVRDAIEPDRAFIMSTWLRHYRDYAFTGRRPVSCLTCEGCGNRIGVPRPSSPLTSSTYFAGHKPLVESILTYSDVLVCCNIDDPEQIYGWLCHSPGPILHYTYIKFPFRQMGLATHLLNTAGVSKETPAVWTHTTPNGERFLGAYRDNFDPYEGLSHEAIAARGRVSR